MIRHLNQAVLDELNARISIEKTRQIHELFTRQLYDFFGAVLVFFEYDVPEDVRTLASHIDLVALPGNIVD